jgi:hypothetical protein
MDQHDRDVCFVPKADILRRSEGMSLFDHLVGVGEQAGPNGEAERPRGLELDEEIEFRRLHHREVEGLLALYDP